MDPIKKTRETTVDVTEKVLDVSGNVSLGLGLLGGGAILGAKTIYNISSDLLGKKDMKKEYKKQLINFVDVVSSGSMSLDDAIRIYRVKSRKNNGESYALGLNALFTDPEFAGKLTDDQLETMQSKYSKYEQPAETTARWKKRKREPSSQGPSKKANTTDSYDYDEAPAEPIPPPRPTPIPKPTPPTPTPTPTPPPTPSPPEPTPEEIKQRNDEAERTLKQQLYEKQRLKAAEDLQKAERQMKGDQMEYDLNNLQAIPSDTSIYQVAPTVDSMAATSAGIQQLLFRGGMAGGGLLAQRLLSAGGPYGYLGAAAVAGGTLTLDMMNRMYGQHYTRSYSERRGAKAADVLYDNFGSPALAAERAISSLESGSPGERAPTNVVSAFSKSLKSFQTGVNQVEQENRALSNYMRDSGPLVVPH